MMATIVLRRGDITRIAADAIVNAANSSLLGGGGVDGAIHRAGGPSILKECIRIRNERGGCHPGEAVITGAGNLPARFVIHTVGPVWANGTQNEHLILARAYFNSLDLAAKHGVKKIAFPNISTGIYGYPKNKAAEIAIVTTRDFLAGGSDLEEVIFVCYDDENHRIYQQLLGNHQ